MITKKNDSIIFVTGIARSGTNLLRAMLGSHPNLYSYNRDLTDEIKEHIRFGDSSRLEIVNITDKITSYLYEKSFCPDNKRLVIKNHFMLDYPEFINSALPNAYIILITRDPRGVYSSRIKWRHTPGKEENQTIEKLIQDWTNNYHEYCMANSILKSHLIKIKYEDLCSKPEEILKDICYKIGETYHSDMLDFDNKWGMMFKGGLNVNKRSNSSFLNELDGKELIYKNSIDKWKDVLSKSQIDEITEKLGYIMKECGYETS